MAVMAGGPPLSDLRAADITLNGQGFAFTTAPTGATAADVQNTVTHEVGHLLGFDHSPDPESTMFADAPLGETKKRDLTADDAQGLCDVYPLGHEPGRPTRAAPTPAHPPPTTAAARWPGTASAAGRSRCWRW
jgi:hypothetical protein